MFPAFHTASLTTNALLLASAAEIRATNISFVQSFLGDAKRVKTQADIKPYLRCLGPAFENITELDLAEEAYGLARSFEVEEPSQEGEDLLGRAHDFIRRIREGNSDRHKVSYVEALAANKNALANLADIELQVHQKFSARVLELEELDSRTSSHPPFRTAAKFIMRLEEHIPHLLELDLFLNPNSGKTLPPEKREHLRQVISRTFGYIDAADRKLEKVDFDTLKQKIGEAKIQAAILHTSAIKLFPQYQNIKATLGDIVSKEVKEVMEKTDPQSADERDPAAQLVNLLIESLMISINYFEPSED